MIQKTTWLGLVLLTLCSLGMLSWPGCSTTALPPLPQEGSQEQALDEESVLEESIPGSDHEKPLNDTLTEELGFSEEPFVPEPTDDEPAQAEESITAGEDGGLVTENDTGSDGTVDRRCKAGGAGTETLGQDCGCDADCAAASPRCGKNPVVDLWGSSYCTKTCAVDNQCPTGYGCLTDVQAFKIDPFCQKCTAPTPATVDLGGKCVCNADCKKAVVNNTERATACVSGKCYVSPCDPTGSFPNLKCPEKSNCEIQTDLKSICVPCLNAAPADEGSGCSCAKDCQSGLKCFQDKCSKPCQTDSGCGAAQECREQIAGGSFCENLPSNCQRSHDKAIGSLCSCSADCADSAPVCLAVPNQFYPVAACTLRPCDLRKTDACPASSSVGDFRCCAIPLVMEATCIPSRLANQMGTTALCNPNP